MLINCMQQAMNQLKIDYFRPDIDFPTAKNERLLLFRQIKKLLDINPFKDYKTDKYVNYILLSIF